MIITTNRSARMSIKLKFRFQIKNNNYTKFATDIEINNCNHATLLPKNIPAI